MDDRTLKTVVIDELDWRPSVNAKDIAVGVDGGVVTLSGHVASYAEKFEVEKAAKHIHGVKALVDKVEVRLSGSGLMADDEIAKRVLQSLSWAVTVPKDQVQVQVESGWVTLAGELEWQFQSNAASGAVRNLLGVKGVSNQITLKERPTPVDVKVRIEGALRRSAELEAKDIRVAVSGNEVTLDGKVRSWYERGRAEDAAWMAPGVRSVVDRLSVG
jgi:osmotically-inducible protein OsmY